MGGDGVAVARGTVAPRGTTSDGSPEQPMQDAQNLVFTERAKALSTDITTRRSIVSFR